MHFHCGPDAEKQASEEKTGGRYGDHWIRNL